MGTCKECGIRHPDWNCPIENGMNNYYQPFFEAFLDSHAIVCKYKKCVCRSDSFIKLISTPVFINSKKYGKLIERILSRDKPNDWYCKCGETNHTYRLTCKNCKQHREKSQW